MLTAELQRNGTQPEDGSDAAVTRRGRGKSGPHPVDIHVGSRLRLRRMMLGLSQSRLGEGVGLTFQQIQKYERGANRMGASRLYELARVLDVPISYFFEEMPSTIAKTTPAIAADTASGKTKPATTDMPGLRVLSAYHRVGDRRVQKAVYDLMQSISGSKAGR